MGRDTFSSRNKQSKCCVTTFSSFVITPDVGLELDFDGINKDS